MTKNPAVKLKPDTRQIVPVSTKVSEPLARLILEIGGADDRKKGYVVRELMRRGLTLYQKDGQIKATQDEEQMIAAMLGNSKSTSKP